MIQVTTDGLKRNLAETVNRCFFGKETVVVTRHGRPLVKLIPADASDAEPKPKGKRSK